MNRKLAPFLITIGPRSLGRAYPVRAIFERAEIASQLQLSDQLLDLAERLAQPGPALALGDPAALGRALGQALLTPQLREMLLRSAKSSAQQGSRMQLQLQIAPPELAMLPWEWLTVGAERQWSPALRDDYALARVSRSVRPAPPLPVLGPLRVLAIAGPGEELQLQALEAALADPIRSGKIELQMIADATAAAFERALAAGPVHILHCAAPASRSERGAPRLLLRQSIDLFEITELLASAQSLRLISLVGPQGDATTIESALPAIAATLLAPDLPATIAFAEELPARHAAAFAAACYSSLALGQPIDLAAAAGRRALANLGSRAWGAPQLRLAPGGEQIFLPQQRPPVLARLPRNSLAAAGGLALVAALVFGARALGAGMTNPLASQPAASSAPAPTAALMALEPSATLLPAPTLSEPTAAPTAPAATPLAGPASIPAPASYATFMTGPNDTLEQIAARMGSDASAIAALNHLDPAAPLRAERPLVIPVYTAGEPGAGGLVIRRGNPAEPKVALTFDIEIDAKTLYGLLEILRQRGLHGTFFVTGRWVQAFPDAARAIVEGGHEINNHSLTHPFFSRIGLDGAASELEKTEQIIHDATGATARPYFRFPYGDFTADTAALVAREGYVAYHWSADDNAIPGWLDWAAQHPNEANGAILLFHGRPGTVDALPGWLDRLAALGLQPGTLTDTLR